jgi:ribonucleoside-diphosphate reductase alpha chain
MMSGNPGLLFLDRFNEANSVPSYPITSAAPCGEVGLSNADACHIGYINLSSAIENGKIDWRQIDHHARQLTRVLDDCIQITLSSNAQPFDAVKKMRRIIVGVSGFADLLEGIGVDYYSREAISIANKVGETVAFATVQESIDLANERGGFPEFHNSRFLDSGWTIWGARNRAGRKDWESIAKMIMERGIRNASTTAIPPGETAATYFGVTPSIEPIGYQHSVNKTLQNIEAELGIMEAFQIWNDGAIAKTINIPWSTSITEIKEVLHKAMGYKIRGITLYRNQTSD